MDNTVPSLERALAALCCLGEHRGGLSAAELGKAAQIPRATLYRIVRVLKSSGFVAPAPGDDQRLVLGPALLRLAARTRRPHDVVDTLRPLLDALSEETGETVKLVMRDRDEAVTLAVSQSRIDSRIASRVGTRLPLFVGASQRLLLAHAPQDVVDAVLQAPLPKRASRTVASAADLRRQLPGLRDAGCAAGHSEGVEGVGAFAAAVPDAQGDVSIALVSVYVHAGKTAAERQRIAAATRAVAVRAAAALQQEGPAAATHG